MKENVTEVIVIGASILDVPVGPVDQSVFATGSHPVDAVRLYPGGDALNESIILSRLGHRVHLISRIGKDMAGEMILKLCRKEGVDTSGIRQVDGIDTGVNLVLVEESGERSFITSVRGSLRKQDPLDVVIPALPKAKILMLASIFTYPAFTVDEMERIFREAKGAGYLVCADMTKCKQKETLRDIEPALRFVDYIFPNLEEAAMVSGLTDPEGIAKAFLEAGVGTIVLKLGKEGCLIGTLHENTADFVRVPAVQNVQVVDTTGAGDTFAAAFLSGLLEGKTPKDCAAFANAAAAVTIREFGATTALKGREQITVQ